MGGRRHWTTRPVGILQHWLDGSCGSTSYLTSGKRISGRMIGSGILWSIIKKTSKLWWLGWEAQFECFVIGSYQELVMPASTHAWGHFT